jgi:HSP20 family protein
MRRGTTMAFGLAPRDILDAPEMMLRRVLESDLDKSWLRVEEFDDEGTLVVRVELPGIDPDKDVDVSVADGVLRIRAERQEKSEDKKKGSYRSEFRYGSFARNIALPAGASEADVTAGYRDGVLEVRVPTGEEPEPKAVKIPITRS